MSVYLVGYDLNKPGQEYGPLYDELKSASSWWHYLDSTWLISSSQSIEIWQQKVKSKIDANDSFIILELTPGAKCQGWLPQKAWDWMKTHLDGA